MNKVFYGNPNDIDVFDENYLSDADRIKSGKAMDAVPQEMRHLYQAMLDSVVSIKNREVYHAELVGENDTEVLFDIGGKDYIRVDKNRREIAFLRGHKVGDYMDVLITSISDQPYVITGSVASLEEGKVHEELKDLNDGQYVEVLVKEFTPAGYNLEIIHGNVILDAFMPNTLAGVNKLHNPESLVGQTVKVAIESYSAEKGTYIVSRRKYLKSLIKTEIKKLKYDEIYTGHVTGTTPFGVFVEFNECLTGMIHKTNLHPDWQNRIKEIKPGFEIDFYVKEIIKQKIILTQIQRESLWDTININQKLNGKVKDIKSFGVLVSLDQETVGLIHTSELDKINQKFEKGEEVNIRVLSVDRLNRKIFLTAEK